MRRLKAKFILAPLAVATLFLSGPGLAQDAPPLAELWITVPKAGHVQEFNEALKKHVAFRSEQGDPWQWNVYTPLLGDDLGRIAVRSCCYTWADVDSYSEWLK